MSMELDIQRCSCFNAEVTALKYNYKEYIMKKAYTCIKKSPNKSIYSKQRWPKNHVICRWHTNIKVQQTYEIILYRTQ